MKIAKGTKRMTPDRPDDADSDVALLARSLSGPSRRPWALTTAVIVCACICLRLALNFAGTYPPGIDAAYYPMQTLYWFKHGRLMYADLPLLFWTNIALTRALTLTGQPLEAAALLASRILDSVLQPWTAVVFMVAGYAWSDGRPRGTVVAGVAALLVTVSGPILRLLSDFEKNSLGLVLMAAAIWTCRSAMLAPTGRNWAALALFLLLSALTHIGTFAVTTVAVSVSLLLWCWQRRRRQLAAILVVGAAWLALLVGVLSAFDSHRALSIIVSPAAVFLRGPIEFPPPPALVLLLAIVVVAVRRVRLDRDGVPPSDAVLVAGLAVTLVFLLVPKHDEHFDRLLLMAPVPATFLILFVLSRRVVSARSLVPTYLLALLILIPIEYPSLRRGSLMNERAASDMVEISRQIGNPERTLIVAPHGLEWWAGYFLGTPVAMRKPAALDRRHDRLLLLRHTETLGLLPGPVSPEPIPPPARLIYKGQAIEIYDAFPGDR